jgi:two-component system catabolic regulation response regulator CreB/two-component system response regulator ChvI
MKNEGRILLVDDEPDIAFALSMGLEDNGFAVDTFNDPLLALQSFKQKHNKKESYALALIDYRMPKMNGFELYNEMRKIDNKVKVCLITAYDIQKESLKAAIPELKAEKAVIIKNQLKRLIWQRL